MKNERVKMIGAKMVACPSFLSLGLKFVNVEYRPSTNLLGESVVLNFSNENMRSVQVIYYPEPDNKDYFLINLVNDENKDVFNIKDWLKKHNALEKVSPFKLANYSGGFEERLCSFVVYLNGLLNKNELSSILRGDSWESVTFDWAGMK